MDELIKKFSDIEHCPVRNVVSHFSTKWGLLVLLVLGEAECVRFNEMSKILPDISSKVLTSTLKTLEKDGLISRRMYACIPPKVEYRITDKGKSLIPILGELVKWAMNNKLTK